MYDQSTKEELLYRLETISPFRRNLDGICSIIYSEKDETDLLFKHIASYWPEHSGQPNYPVPHPERSPRDAYMSANEDEMWSRDHPYGAARWRLIEFCIAELEKDLGEE